MSNEIEAIRALQKRAHDNAKAKGFYDCKTCGGTGGGEEGGYTVPRCGECAGTGTQSRNVPEAIALIHSELSEALEFYRNRNDGHVLSKIFYSGTRESSKPDGFMVELADVFIRLLDLSEYVGGDLGAAVAAKMDFNTKRPHRHGNKAC